MSLQIWLPLNGDLTQQGLSNATVTASTTPTYTDNGKIGKALSRGKIKIDSTTAGTIFNNKSCSMAFWYNNGGSTVSHAICGVQGNAEGTNGTEPRQWDFFNYPTKNDFHWSMGSISSGVLNGIIPDDTWIHFAFVLGDGKFTIYKNGSVIWQGSSNPTFTTYAYDYYISFGHAQYMNDFRIYDHALSAKEVQELAKGLVLHYRLAGPGQENLIKASGPKEDGWGINQSGGTFTKTITAEGTSFEVTTQATSWFLYYHNFSNLSTAGLKPNTEYTYSFECKSNQSFNLDIKILKGNGTIPLTNNKAVRIEGDNEWHKYKVTLTTNSTLDISDQYFYMTGGNLISKTQFRYAKLEEGTIATPWTPHPSDTTWTTMGYSNNIEYDCSGFGNNGTKGDNIIWDANSARYTTSYKFDNKDRISMPDIPFQNFKEGTFSIWLKVNSYGIWTHYAFFANGFNWTGQGIDSIIIANHSASTNAVILDCCSYISQHSLALNTWNLCTITWDKNYQIKKYVNGQLIATHDDSVNKRLDTYMTKHGTCGLGNVTQSDSNKGDFNLTDCRIYATALSAAAIEELYHSAVIVDNSGKTYAYEYFEAT